MPRKQKTYDRVVFTPEVIKEAEETLRTTLPKKDTELSYQRLGIAVSGEEWEHDSEEEFFADYRKNFWEAHFSKHYTSLISKFPSVQFSMCKIELSVYRQSYRTYTRVAVEMPSRADVEKVFQVLEANVEKCRLPKQPDEKSKVKTDWVIETVKKVEGRCPIAGRKLKLALIKLDSDEAEEWQNATMLIRDAWIELTQWLCQVNNIDTSDIPSDAVIDRLRKLKIDNTDERLFNLARASFNLYAKHHKRAIDNDTAVACVISTIVSMQTVIREAF